MKTTHEVPNTLSLVKYCLCFFPNIQLIKHIISISDDSILTLQHIVNYISQHETTDIHIQTLKQIADRRWYVHGSKLALPTTKKLYDIVFSMYNHYCKQHLNTFMKYLYEQINNITQLVRYCENNGLFNHLLITLCAYLSDDCKYYKRGISKQTLLTKYAKQRGELTTVSNTTLDDICFQPFVATLYLTNNSNVIAGDTDTNIQNATRVALVPQGNISDTSNSSGAQALHATDSTGLVIWEPNADQHSSGAVANAANYDYVGAITAGTGNATLKYYGVKAPITPAEDVDSIIPTYLTDMYTT